MEPWTEERLLAEKREKRGDGIAMNIACGVTIINN